MTKREPDMALLEDLRALIGNHLADTAADPKQSVDQWNAMPLWAYQQH